MPETSTDNSPIRRRKGFFGLTRRSAASWSERASNEASSALAAAPGVAEEKAERQGAPEPEEGVVETSCPPAPDSVAPSTQPPADVQPSAEQPSWRDLDAPVLPALMNRKRTVEKRDQEKTIRFTRTAVSVISAAAHQRGQKLAGFVGDAALAVALGKAGLVGSPEDDPVRPLIEAVEAHGRAEPHRRQPQPDHRSHPPRNGARACRGGAGPRRASRREQLPPDRPAPDRRHRPWFLTSPPAPTPAD